MVKENTFIKQTSDTASAWLNLANSTVKNSKLSPDEKAQKIVDFLQSSAKDQSADIISTFTKD